jgi:hypothetical protein
MKQKLFDALLRKDKYYVGKYYAAIKTTRIFCKMDCGCKKPLYDNTFIKILCHFYLTLRVQKYHLHHFFHIKQLFLMFLLVAVLVMIRDFIREEK